MIRRQAAIAGVLAGFIYLMFFLAYEVSQGWDVPLWLVIGLGLIVTFATALVTNSLLTAAIERRTSQDL